MFIYHNNDVPVDGDIDMKKLAVHYHVKYTVRQFNTDFECEGVITHLVRSNKQYYLGVWQEQGEQGECLELIEYTDALLALDTNIDLIYVIDVVEIVLKSYNLPIAPYHHGATDTQSCNEDNEE